MRFFQLSMRLFLCSVLFVLSSCEEEPPNSSTEGNILTEEGKLYFSGDDVTLDGVFKDLQGFKSIEIFNETLKVDKEYIIEDEIVYHLNYTFGLPEDLYPEVHDVLITTTNENDKSTEFHYSVDYAVRPRAENFGLYFKGEEGQEIKFEGTLIDPQGLHMFLYYCLNLDLFFYIYFPDGTYEYILQETFEIPEDSPVGLHQSLVIFDNKRGITSYILGGKIEVLERNSGN